MSTSTRLLILLGQDCVQHGLDVVDGFVQVFAHIGSEVLAVNTESVKTSFVHNWVEFRGQTAGRSTQSMQVYTHMNYYYFFFRMGYLHYGISYPTILTKLSTLGLFFSSSITSFRPPAVGEPSSAGSTAVLIFS